MKKYILKLATLIVLTTLVSIITTRIVISNNDNKEARDQVVQENLPIKSVQVDPGAISSKKTEDLPTPINQATKKPDFTPEEEVSCQQITVLQKQQAEKMEIVNNTYNECLKNTTTTEHRYNICRGTQIHEEYAVLTSSPLHQYTIDFQLKYGTSDYDACLKNY